MNFKDKCYVCNAEIEHAYQVKIITRNGNINFVKCCCLKHAELLKDENADLHKTRYDDVNNQCIQRFS